MLNVTFSSDIYRRLDFGMNISHEAQRSKAAMSEASL